MLTFFFVCCLTLSLVCVYVIGTSMTSGGLLYQLRKESFVTQDYDIILDRRCALTARKEQLKTKERGVITGTRNSAVSVSGAFLHLGSRRAQRCQEREKVGHCICVRDGVLGD